VPLLYVTEGLAMGTFQIFNLPQPTGVRDLKSEGPPIAGPSPITKWKFKFKNYNVNWLLDTCQNQLFPKSLNNETYICHKRLHHISST
jgi:hypothetical protein